MLLWVNGYLTCGHVAIITKTKSTYVIIESTLRCDDVEDIPGLLPLLQAVQRTYMRSREWSGRRPGNEASNGLYGDSSQCICKSIGGLTPVYSHSMYVYGSATSCASLWHMNSKFKT